MPPGCARSVESPRRDLDFAPVDEHDLVLLQVLVDTDRVPWRHVFHADRERARPQRLGIDLDPDRLAALEHARLPFLPREYGRPTESWV